MNFEEQAANLQKLKAQAAMDPNDARSRLLSELTDTVSMLCHQVYSLGAVVDGLNDSLEEVQEVLSYDLNVDEADEDGNLLGVDEYYDGSETPLYEVKCPQCGDKFAVDEQTLRRGFSCPGCGEKLIEEEQ